MFDTNTVQPHKPITDAQIQRTLLTALVLREMTTHDHNGHTRDQDAA